MMSMSGGWFFVVASEAISVGDNTWKLPGIGSYVALALERRDIAAVAYAILAMLVVILAYDQLLFRPLVAWSAKFRFETTAGATADDPWMLQADAPHAAAAIPVGDALGAVSAWRSAAAASRSPGAAAPRPRRRRALVDGVWLLVLGVLLASPRWRVVDFVATEVDLARRWPRRAAGPVHPGARRGADAAGQPRSGCRSAYGSGCARSGRAGRSRWRSSSRRFPANLLFPPFVVVIVTFHLNVDIWLTPLMVLGTQWYILFNVIAGAAAFPGDLREAAENFRVGGLLWWRKVIFPGIFAYYVTGAITASGGSWNAAIVAEVASWGNTKLTAHGLGAYIAQATEAGDMARVVLGVAVMSGFVVLFNRLLWRPLYAYAERQPHAWLKEARMDTTVTAPALLEVQGCRQAYHKEASADLVVLDDVNLDLREGEIVALLGRSGSGKSTLLRIVAGLLTPTAGDVLWRGRKIATARPRAWRWCSRASRCSPG